MAVKSNLVAWALMAGLAAWGYSAYQSANAPHHVTSEELAEALKATEPFKRELQQKPEFKGTNLGWVDHNACMVLFTHKEKPYIGREEAEKRCERYKPRTCIDEKGAVRLRCPE